METVDLETKKRNKYRLGVLVFVLLAALTVVEFGVAWFGKNLVYVLILIALFKAFLVIRDYMHIGRFISGEEE